jgi:hypothetical protein
MRIRALVPVLLACFLAGCGGDDPPAGGGGTTPAKPPTPAPATAPTPSAAGPKLDASTPKALAESIFAIAKSGELALLATIADPQDSDGDSKEVAAIAKAPAVKQAGFRAAFGPGKVSGEVKVEGDQAEVPILFGPEGKQKPETFKMVKRGGTWYLQSF